MQNLKFPLKLKGGEICDAEGNKILEISGSFSGLKPSERNDLLVSIVESMNSKNTGNHLNENAQLGDKVLYKGHRGYVIGQTFDGDFVIQVQGSTSFVKPKDVKVLGIKTKTMEPPFKFDEKTQKVLFEQFVKCGIYMGNVPVKVSNCYVKYSEWKSAGLNENVNVFTEDGLNIMPRENVRVFEDPNNFANPQDYVEGVIIDEASGNALENVMINAIDYSSAIGDAENIRVIRGYKEGNPELSNFPKGSLRTLTI